MNLHFNYRVAKISRPFRQTRLSVMKHIFALARVDVRETDSHLKIRSLSAENLLKIFPLRTACGGVFLSELLREPIFTLAARLVVIFRLRFPFFRRKSDTIHSAVECFVRLLLAFSREKCVSTVCYASLSEFVST